MDSSRKKEIVRCRFIAIKLLRDTGMALTHIGENMGGRNHATVSNALNNIDNRTWPGILGDIKEIKEDLKLVKSGVRFEYCKNQDLFKTYKMRFT